MNASLVNSLQQTLDSIIPGARLVCTPLPDMPAGMSLYLIDGNFPAERLDDEVVRQLWYNTPYWVFCWAAGLAQARWILQNPHSVRNRTVLDFGTGSGVVAIAASMAGARKVIACDIDPFSIDVCRINARLNGVELAYLDDFFQLDEPVDVLFAADVLYDRSNQFFLDEFVLRAEEVWVADSRVKNFNHPKFVKTATNEASTWPDLDESPEFRQVHFYHGTAGALNPAPAGTI